jgi:hypothetical protein
MDVSSESDDCAALSIVDSLPSDCSLLRKVHIFLLNVREIVCIISNLFYNQLKIIVNTRVNYAKEEFNYETYLPKAISDNKLLVTTFFNKSGKHLVAEYFKFHLL